VCRRWRWTQDRTQCVESTPEAIAAALERYGPIDRAVIETGRMTPSVALGLRALGVAIVCIDARQAHQSLKTMKANKTDPHDAAGLRSWRVPASTRRCTLSRRQRTA
jgi:transposase